MGKLYKYSNPKKSIMSKRVTIMIEDDLDKKVRMYQIKKIQKENKSYSYSKAIKDILKKAI